MFTGLIEEIGTLVQATSNPRGLKLVIGAKLVLNELKPDDSVAVNGVCLTVTRVVKERFEADAVEETVRRTTLQFWTIGKKVNLERAIRADSRFGGHFVQGHVDGSGKIVSIQREGNGKRMEIEAAPEVSRYIIQKGSVAVDGVSLTVAGMRDHCFWVALIPHTLERSNLDSLKTGDAVNIETDVLGKYVERFVHSSKMGTKELDEKRMRELGY